jgi:hypothetical protein
MTVILDIAFERHLTVCYGRMYLIRGDEDVRIECVADCQCDVSVGVSDVAGNPHLYFVGHIEHSEHSVRRFFRGHPLDLGTDVASASTSPGGSSNDTGNGFLLRLRSFAQAIGNLCPTFRPNLIEWGFKTMAHRLPLPL